MFVIYAYYTAFAPKVSCYEVNLLLLFFNIYTVICMVTLRTNLWSLKKIKVMIILILIFSNISYKIIYDDDFAYQDCNCR